MGTHDDMAVKDVLDLIGPELAKVVSKDDLMMDVFRRNADLFSHKPPRIAVVGSTRVGKTTLVGKLLDKDLKLATDLLSIRHKPDTTSQVVRIQFPSGLILYDTPGVGGFKDVNENLTRAFLGLDQRVTRRLRKVSSVPLQSYDAVTSHQMGREFLKPSRRASPRYDLVLFVLDIQAYREDDLTFFHDVKKRCSKESPSIPVVLVANKIDLMDEQSGQMKTNLTTIRKEFGSDVLAISADQGRNLQALVTRIFLSLPTGAASLFNVALDQQLKHQRDQRIHDIGRRVAAKAATTNVAEISKGTGEPVLMSLLRGLMLRITMEYTGVTSAKAIRDQLSEAIASVYEGVRQSRTIHQQRLRKEERKRRVVEKVWKEVGNKAPQGGLAGALTGAGIGSAILPGFGTLVGGLLGLLLGAGAGSEIREMKQVPVERVITEVVRIPEVVAVPQQGGHEGAMVVMAFGRAYHGLLQRLESGQDLEDVGDRFEESLARELQRCKQRISSVSSKLDRATDPIIAEQLLLSIETR